jgi:hypothetical protein
MKRLINYASFQKAPGFSSSFLLVWSYDKIAKAITKEIPNASSTHTNELIKAAVADNILRISQWILQRLLETY